MMKLQCITSNEKFVRSGLMALAVLLFACVLMVGPALAQDTPVQNNEVKVSSTTVTTVYSNNSTYTEITEGSNITKVLDDTANKSKVTVYPNGSKLTEDSKGRSITHTNGTTDKLKTPAPLLSGLLGLFAAGLLLRRRE